MTTIGSERTLYRLLSATQRLMADLWARAAERAAAQVLGAQGADGRVDPARLRGLRTVLGRLIEDTYDGPYTDALNRALVGAVVSAVQPHTAYMRRVMPADLQAQLTQRRVSEQGPSDRLFRLFRPNPLAQYDAPHEWVDPSGYRLSDRIWRNAQATRLKLDRILTAEINKGTSAVDIARLVEASIKPSRRLIITTKPYPKPYDVAVSYDAMRLARSEITRAHGQAAKVAALANPYVTEMDWRLSAAHPKQDICDDLAARGPYPVEKAPVPVQDSHPFCLCSLIPRVGRKPSEVTAELRAKLEEAEREQLQPNLTPLQSDAFIRLLLGRALETLLAQAA